MRIPISAFRQFLNQFQSFFLFTSPNCDDLSTTLPMAEFRRHLSPAMRKPVGRRPPDGANSLSMSRGPGADSLYGGETPPVVHHHPKPSFAALEHQEMQYDRTYVQEAYLGPSILSEEEIALKHTLVPHEFFKGSNRAYYQSRPTAFCTTYAGISRSQQVSVKVRNSLHSERLFIFLLLFLSLGLWK